MSDQCARNLVAWAFSFFFVFGFAWLFGEKIMVVIALLLLMHKHAIDAQAIARQMDTKGGEHG